MNKHLISIVIAAGIVGSSASGMANAATHGVKKASHKKTKTTHITLAGRANHHRHHYRLAAAVAEDPQHLVVQSSSVLVLDEASGAVLFEKNAQAVLPIASISKLMTAMVTLDANPNLKDTLTIDGADVDDLKGTRSRLKVGTELSREEMLRLALMSSENRAASSLARYYPGGRSAFVAAMNAKSKMLGLTDTHFEDPTGLTAANVSSARDLVKMVSAAHTYPMIREFTTTAEYDVAINGREKTFHNTNPLVRSRNNDWEIGLSKTGYINEAGKCLVMQAWFNNKPTIIVLLDSWGRLTRIGDANRIKRWMESAVAQRPIAG
jgi:serine-type D-Ala-D-Ala endopeptidase (penicillin-binding protein 7)